MAVTGPMKIITATKTILKTFCSGDKLASLNYKIITATVKNEFEE